MGHMKKYSCPHCQTTTSVIRKTKRGKSIRYFCKACTKYFSISPHFFNTIALLNDHLDGLSFRKLAAKYNISKSHAWDICNEQLQRLPDNNQFTHKYCSRFSSTLVVDGKYFKVKGKKYGYCLLWGVDYFRHDIPISIVAPSENYHNWARYFSYYRIISDHPELLVCDDNVNIKMAARARFPAVTIQTCTNHFKENIRRTLKTRSDDTYKPFMRSIEAIFTHKRTDADMFKQLHNLWDTHQHDPVCLSVLANIQKYHHELTGYRGVTAAPITTNIIESLNSHLQARLKPLRSFENVRHAKLWLNGYVLRRRYTKWTDCKGKFRNLNGKRGVDMTKKHGIVLPTYF